MESKINYHALTIDEIVFDNRNQAYGAFVVRQLYKKNQSKALLISASIFLLAMASPIILKTLGILAQQPHHIITKTIHILEDIQPFNYPLTEQQTPVSKPAGNRNIRSKEFMPVDPDDATQPDEMPEKTSTPEVTQPENPGPGQTGADHSGQTPLSPHTGITPPHPDYSGTTEEKPQFPGGQEAFELFVEENLIYPPQESGEGVEGVAKIQFIVNEDGSIGQVRVAESSGYPNLDAAAVKLIKKQPRYRPGRQNGIAVRVLCVIPIGFEMKN